MNSTAQDGDKVVQRQNALKQKYDDFVFVDDPIALERAKGLLSQIGEIDLDIERLKSRENQRDLSIKFHWGHNHKFNEEIHVPGRMGDRHLNLMAQFLTELGYLDDHFAGKNVIDVGCWTGGTTLLLKAMGANNILALEEVQKYARACKELFEGVYNLEGLTCDGTNLYHLVSDEKFDIAYFPGVVYHLSDPVLGLRRLFNALSDGGEIFVESAGIESSEPICRFEGNRKYHKNSSETADNLNRGGWNWFLPSPHCLNLWMQEAGFEETRCWWSPYTGRVFGYGKRNRHIEITRAGFSVPDIE